MAVTQPPHPHLISLPLQVTHSLQDCRARPGSCRNQNHKTLLSVPANPQGGSSSLRPADPGTIQQEAQGVDAPGGIWGSVATRHVLLCWELGPHLGTFREQRPCFWETPIDPQEVLPRWQP